jgi:hypothetical protein
MSAPFRPSVDLRHIVRVREGHGANCSSVGSVVDMLFVSAVAGGAVLAAVAAALRSEPIILVGEDTKAARKQPETPHEGDDAT